ncbi:hypothetical protein RBH29_06645 [Herbivorax sp. ANBcel31]|uniref:hypothetical protein n=1 Tax=Herbivorax sp. ANBcel31 TaxID=3069754 RepID=UPI0027B694C7|nr:hypothetical protein [Herbivorax sp. ANBcel31]MDQ2086111.1 hypothetical protein [Herbivorax sp. ANBcel31]
MRQKIVVVVIFLLFIALSSTLYYQYKENQKYISYLSSTTFTDFSSRIHSPIQYNREMYSDIIESETISIYQLEQLLRYNSAISRKIHKYDKLALNTLNRIDDIDDSFFRNPESIGNFFILFAKSLSQEDGYKNYQAWLLETDDSKEYPLNQSQLEKILIIQSVNELWKQSFLEHLGDVLYPDKGGVRTSSTAKYHKNGIKDDYWVNIILSMKEKTNEFLKSYESADTLGDILLDY